MAKGTKVPSPGHPLAERQVEVVVKRKGKRLLETTAATLRVKAARQGKVYEGDVLDPVAIEAGVRVMLAISDTNAAGMDGDEWEDMVFLCSEDFTATIFVGRGEHERYEFKDPISAIEKAASLEWHGRQGIAYAMTKAGRQVCLSRKDWPRFRLMWAAKLKIQGVA